MSEPIKRCPVCGDFDIGDFCQPCQAATVEEYIEFVSEAEQAEADQYFSEQHQRWIDEQTNEGE